MSPEAELAIHDELSEVLSRVSLEARFALAEARVRREVVWFAAHANLPLDHPERRLRATTIQSAIIVRDGLRAMVRTRKAGRDV